MEYLIILFRSTLFYLLINLFYRLMGKREIGELSIMDFIVSIFIAEVAGISIENYNDSIFRSLIPIIVLVLLQVIFSYITLKNNKFREIVDGKPSVIIKEGKINFEEMLKQRYNLDDLLTQLREKSVKSIADVDYAILETSGKLSVFAKDEKNKDYPLAIILDGKIEEDVLKEINKNTFWLEDQLEEQKISLDEVFYAFYKDKDLYIIEKSKIKWQYSLYNICNIILVIKWKKLY